jgi:hypothetical protein
MPGTHPHRPVEGATDDWWTPPLVFTALGIDFDLDPCAPVGGVPWVPAREHYSENGLQRPWFGSVWMNPPYGRQTGAWMKRLAEHGDGVALVFARTDVRWWHDAIPGNSPICFLDGRLTFIPGDGSVPSGNSGGPSALIGYGARCARAVRACGLGMIR